MENASRALLMAGGVLISVLIISLAVFLYGNFSSSAKENIKQMEQTQTTSFNGQFLAYEGKEDLTYFDVINIVSIAINSNKSYEIENQPNSDYYIQVKVNGYGYLTSSANNYKNYKDFKEASSNLKDAPKEVFEDGIYKDSNNNPSPSKELKKYKCTKIKYNQNSGRINYIEIE